MDKIVYRDVDFISSPDGWLAAKLQNKLEQGYEIIRDPQDLAWICVKQDSAQKQP